MKRILQEDLIYEILSVVGEIPEGSVATYGQIARLIGRDKNARLVGRVLSMADRYGIIPVTEWSITQEDWRPAGRNKGSCFSGKAFR